MNFFIIIFIWCVFFYYYVEYENLYSIVFSGSTITFFLLEGHLIVSNIVSKYYRRIKFLNSVIPINYTNFCWYTVVMFFKLMYISFIQYINKSVRIVGKNTYEVSYIINGKLYKMIVNVERGPSPILQISDENFEDITDEILPYLGPSNNWHKRKFCAFDFDKNSLTFELSNGEERIFEKEEIINIK